jgi:hypothetical protein
MFSLIDVWNSTGSCVAATITHQATRCRKCLHVLIVLVRAVAVQAVASFIIYWYLEQDDNKKSAETY